MFRSSIISSMAEAIAVIGNSLKASLANRITFPEHVKAIAAVGVVRYTVDLLQNKATYVFHDHSTHVEQLPSIEEKAGDAFSSEEVKNAVSEIQRKIIDYPAFLRKIVAAGTIFYEVDLAAQKVTYAGANRESHIEIFPETKSPEPAELTTNKAETSGLTR